LVAFQFAIAALTTGAFSLFGATVEFVFAFFGGIVMGVLMGLLVNFLSRKVRDIGLENTTFHVLLEVFTPFIVYLACNGIGMSGVIAVVAAGLVCGVKNRSAAPSSARMNIVSSSVWRVVSFGLNGIVFVLLGTQLPKVMRTSWQDVAISNEILVAYVLGLTLLLYLIRFIWVLGLEVLEWKRSRKGAGLESRFGKNGEWRSVLITTLSGAKGTITLAAVLSAPTHISLAPAVVFPQRDLIVFLASGVIVVTLLVATFVVPLLAPRRDRAQEEEEARQRETECHVEILRRVAEELTARQTPENRRETRAVVRSYNERIERVKKAGGLEDDYRVDHLRLQAIDWEREYVRALVDGGGADPWSAYQILGSLSRTERLLAHGTGRWSIKNYYLRIRALLRRGFRTVVGELLNAGLTAERMEKKRQLQIDANEYVTEKLQRLVVNPHSDVPTEVASALLLEYQKSTNALRNTRVSLARIAKAADKEAEVRRIAFQLELEQIQSAYEDGLLNRAAAQRLRENVHLMQMDLEDSV
ncbi:MAG: cation:proton antiporter, partial [Eggerthellaceae bacterium]|nr:cation:proton antiporter [Eggerthellaceae bacterium]